MMMMTDDTVLIPVMMDAGPVYAWPRKTRIAWEKIGRLLTGGERCVRLSWINWRHLILHSDSVAPRLMDILIKQIFQPRMKKGLFFRDMKMSIKSEVLYTNLLISNREEV